MKTILQIPGIFLNEVSTELFEELCSIDSSEQLGGRFSFTGEFHDVKTQNILSCLSRYGFQPMTYVGEPPSNGYIVRLSRIYDKQDYAQFQYLVPRPSVFIDTGLTDDNHVILVSRAEDGGIKPNEDIQAGNWGIIVSDRLKTLFEQSDLKHLAFRETVLDEPNPKLKQAFWELTSDLILPPLSPKCVFIDNTNQIQVYDGDPTKVRLLRESALFPDALFKQAELHYKTGSLDKVAPFDLALTYEKLGQNKRQYLVASQRFYQFCVERKLKMKWQPVRFDDIEE